MHKAVVAPYQAQVRTPSEPARVHPRENGIVQAVVGTCAQAVGLPSAPMGAVTIAFWHGSQCRLISHANSKMMHFSCQY